MLVSDYMHPTPNAGRCRIRIYQRDGELPVVVCTELDDNTGMSITNAAEEIAAEVLANHPDVFDPFATGSIPGVVYYKPFVWIEHYQTGSRGTPSDRATFDLITFANDDPEPVLRAGEWRVELGEPSWKALDRATVEALVGARVD